MGDFIMPTLGADMTEATLVDWLVEPGEKVQRGDIIAEVETGKGIIEIEVFEEGIVEKIIVEPGDTVPVGTVMAIIQTAGEDKTDKPAPGGKASPEASISSPPDLKYIHSSDKADRNTIQSTDSHTTTMGPSSEKRPRIKISPLARTKARDLGIDPTHIQGTGPEGAITAADIEKAATPETQTTWMQGKESQNTKKRSENMRLAIAKATAVSNREIPHYYLQTSIDMHTALTWLKEKNNQRSIQERILPAVLELKAVALAARMVPDLNGFWINDRHTPSPAIHIGFAISLRGGGLMAPAIHDVDTKGLDELMRDLHDLITRTRSGRLRGSEMTDATLTVTNLGDRGVETIYGVIYPPQVALVGLGKIREHPWAEGGILSVRPVLNATLAADHRATDGHTGARFLEALNRTLQQPETL